MDGKEKLYSSDTEDSGYAKFEIEGSNSTEYAIEASDSGFKNGRVKHVYVFNNGTEYVQIQLKLAGKGVTVF